MIKRLFPFIGLLDLLCPPACPICGEVVENSSEHDIQICPQCLEKIVTPDGQFCRRCGGRRFVIPSHTDECPRCRTTHFHFRRAIVLGEYGHDLRLFVLQMKTDKTGMKAISAARVLAYCRRTELENIQTNYIVPVPMYRTRKNNRGVNSPDFIAEELGRHLKIPVLRNLVQRIRNTDLQYTLSHRGRTANVSGAFVVRSPNLWETLGFRQTQKMIAGKNILLVDDILTTGSTCNEITKVLFAAGVQTVTVAALARAEGSYTRERSLEIVH